MILNKIETVDQLIAALMTLIENGTIKGSSPWHGWDDESLIIDGTEVTVINPNK